VFWVWCCFFGGGCVLCFFFFFFVVWCVLGSSFFFFFFFLFFCVLGFWFLVFCVVVFCVLIPSLLVRRSGNFSLTEIATPAISEDTEPATSEKFVLESYSLLCEGVFSFEDERVVSTGWFPMFALLPLEPRCFPSLYPLSQRIWIRRFLRFKVRQVFLFAS